MFTGVIQKMELVSQKYARALRAIGQDLAGLFPECLEIEITGRFFVARGRGRSNSSGSRNDHDRPGILRIIWHKLNQPNTKTDVSSQQALVEFARTYTQDDINRLDEIGAAQQIAKAQTPDIYSLGERLRIIGIIVDGKCAELVKLSQDVNALTLHYRDAEGKIHREEFSTRTLYKFQHQYYEERPPKDPWERSNR